MCSNEFVFYLNNTCVAWWQQRKNSHLFDYSGIFAKTRTGRYQTLSVISYACRISYDARKLLFRGRQILFFLFFFFFILLRYPRPQRNDRVNFSLAFCGWWIRRPYGQDMLDFHESSNARFSLLGSFRASSCQRFLLFFF